MKTASAFDMRRSQVYLQSAGGSEYVTPAQLDDVAFEALLRSVQAGRRSIRGRFRVFKDAPNMNFTRPTPGELPQIAESFGGVPMLADHDGDRVASRIGTVTAPGVVDASGWLVVEVTITTQAAQEAYLRGSYDRFSVRFSYEAAVCSVCGVPGAEGAFGPWLSCNHMLGEQYLDASGVAVLCELHLQGAQAMEVSVVNFPAVTGTGVLAAYTTRNQTGRWPWEQRMAVDDVVAPPVAEEALAEDPRVQELEQELIGLRAAAFAQLFADSVALGYASPSQEPDFREYYAAVGLTKTAAFLRRNGSRNASATAPAPQEAAPPAAKPGKAAYAHCERLVATGQASEDDLAIVRRLYGEPAA